MSFNLLDVINTSFVESDSDLSPTLKPGQMSVLSVGRGDMTIDFNSSDPEEVEKARTVIQDMLRNGYLIYIKIKDKEVRVKSFDPQTNEYIIKIDKRSSVWRNRDKDPLESPKDSQGKPKVTKPVKTVTTRVDAKKSTGTAFAPTGGG